MFKREKEAMFIQNTHSTITSSEIELYYIELIQTHLIFSSANFLKPLNLVHSLFTSQLSAHTNKHKETRSHQVTCANKTKVKERTYKLIISTV